MGSQTLEILRQGVWASLTGGWFYDPHQGTFCNVVHLYLWLFLLCTPFVTYVYFPTTLITWSVYCLMTTLTIMVLKIVNMALHRLYDKAQIMSESNLKNAFFKGSKDGDGREEECGIEMQVLGNDMPSGTSVDQAINEASEENSILSLENVNSIIDLKVDVHRKNSSESIEFMLFAPSMMAAGESSGVGGDSNNKRDKQSVAGSGSAALGSGPTGPPVSTSSNIIRKPSRSQVLELNSKYLSVYPLTEDQMNTPNSTCEQRVGSSSSFSNHQQQHIRKSSENGKKRRQRIRLERQSSLDAAAESSIISKLIRDQSDSFVTTMANRNELFLHHAHPQHQHATFAKSSSASTMYMMAGPGEGSSSISTTSAVAHNRNSNVTTTQTTTSSSSFTQLQPHHNHNHHHQQQQQQQHQQQQQQQHASNTRKTSRLQRHRSSETHEEQQKKYQRSLCLPIHHEQRNQSNGSGGDGSSSGTLAGDKLELGLSCSRGTRGGLQSWVLGSSSDMYLEDSCTKSDLGIEKIESIRSHSGATGSNGGVGGGSSSEKAAFLMLHQQYPIHHDPHRHHHQHHHHHHHHQQTPMRKDSNSTMSALHLPVAASINSKATGSSMKKRRHSNATALYKCSERSTSVQPTVSVRRIKSAALEISCPHPSVSNLSPHPNSVEAISGQQQIKNPQSALLPPPSKCLVRNPHLNLCPKFGSFGDNGTVGFGCTAGVVEPVYPIVEQADEKSSLDLELGGSGSSSRLQGGCSGGSADISQHCQDDEDDAFKACDEDDRADDETDDNCDIDDDLERVHDSNANCGGNHQLGNEEDGLEESTEELNDSNEAVSPNIQQQQHSSRQQLFSTTESESEVERHRTHSTDSETDKNGSRSPLLNNKSRSTTEKAMIMESTSANPTQKHLPQHHPLVQQKNNSIPHHMYDMRLHNPKGEGDSGCPSSDCEQVSASSKDMLLAVGSKNSSTDPASDEIQRKRNHEERDLDEIQCVQETTDQNEGAVPTTSFQQRQPKDPFPPSSSKNLGAIPKVAKYREINENFSHMGCEKTDQTPTSAQHCMANLPTTAHKRKGTGTASGSATSGKAPSRTSSSTSSRSFSAESFSNDIYKTYKDHWVVYGGGGYGPLVGAGDPSGIEGVGGPSTTGSAVSSSAANVATHHYQHYQDASLHQQQQQQQHPSLPLSDRVMYLREKLRRSSKQISDPGISSGKLDEYPHVCDLPGATFIGGVGGGAGGDSTAAHNAATLSIQGLINDFENSSDHARTPGGTATAAILNVDGQIENYCDYWRPACSLSAEKPVVPKRFYKYRFDCFGGGHEFKIEMDRLQLLALFDRDLNWFHVILAVLLSTSVSFLGASILQLGYYRDLFAFLFCAVIASSQYSLVKSVQPDAASPIHGFNKTVAYSRAIYFTLCGGLLLLFHQMTQDYAADSAARSTKLNLFGLSYSPAELTENLLDVMCVFLLAFPLIFSLGLFPQINTFSMYLLEQLDMHVFGGNAAGSLGGAFLCVLRSILGVSLLYGPLYVSLIEGRGTQSILFSFFCAILIPLGYHLSRSASDFSHLWSLIKMTIMSTYRDDDDEISAVTTPSQRSNVSIKNTTNNNSNNKLTSSTPKPHRSLSGAAIGDEEHIEMSYMEKIPPPNINDDLDRKSNKSKSSSLVSSIQAAKTIPPPPTHTTVSATTAIATKASPEDDEDVNDDDGEEENITDETEGDKISSTTTNPDISTLTAGDGVSVVGGGVAGDGGTTTASTANVLDSESPDPLPKKLQNTVNMRLKNDFVVTTLLGVIIFSLHCSTVFTVLQPDLNAVLYLFAAVLGVLLHYIIPQLRKNMPWLCFARPILRQYEFGQFEVSDAAKVMWFEKVYIYLSIIERNVLFPLIVISALTADSKTIAQKYSGSWGPIIVAICSLKFIRNAYSDPTNQYLILIFTVLTFKVDFAFASETFLIDYFFVSLAFRKCCDFLLKLQFIVTYIAPWQITWGSAFHAFAQPFSVPHSAMLFLQAAVSAVLSTPLNPFLGSAIFLTSYVRPIKFWERDYNTRRIDHSNTRLSSQLERDLGADDNNLNSIFYEHLTRSLQHSLCGDLLMGRWGNVNQGDCFVLASDYLNCLVHVIELGNGLCTFQMRGLEFRGTYCQQREVEAITEGVEDNDGCCCCDPGHLPRMLSANAMFSTRWLAWQVVAAQYVLEGYSISDNLASATLQVFEYRKVLITYYIKSIVYFVVKNAKLDEWIESEAIQDALQHTQSRQFVDLDPIFNYNLDEDFDFRALGITRSSYCSVYLSWIHFCCDKRKEGNSSPAGTGNEAKSGPSCHNQTQKNGTTTTSSTNPSSEHIANVSNRSKTSTMPECTVPLAPALPTELNGVYTSRANSVTLPKPMPTTKAKGGSRIWLKDDSPPAPGGGGEDVRKPTERSPMIPRDSPIVSLCLALGLLARRSLATASHSSLSGVEFFLHGLHALFKGDFRITSPRDEWVFADMELLHGVVAPAVKMALKLQQDHISNPDEYLDPDALYTGIQSYSKDLVISHEADPVWRSAVLRGAPNLLALRHVMEDGSDEYRIIRLTKRFLSFRVIKLNRECVRGLWAGQQQELIYLRNRNPERGSIQNAKQALRNIINSSCDQPIGYPIYVSPLTTSYSDTNEQLCRVIGGAITLESIKNNIMNWWHRVRERCRQGCSSGSTIESNLGADEMPNVLPLYFSPPSGSTLGGSGGGVTSGGSVGGGLGASITCGSQSLTGSGFRSRSGAMCKPSSSTLLAGLLNRERDQEREAMRDSRIVRKGQAYFARSDRERRATLPISSGAIGDDPEGRGTGGSSAEPSPNALKKGSVAGTNSNSDFRYFDGVFDFGDSTQTQAYAKMSTSSGNLGITNIITTPGDYPRKLKGPISAFTSEHDSAVKSEDNIITATTPSTTTPTTTTDVVLNKQVIIVDELEVYDCLNLGRSYDVIWPSEKMRASGGRLSWKDWSPSVGMIGYVVHYWSPNHTDQRYRTRVSRTVYLVEIGEHYVPVGESGIKEYKQIVDNMEQIPASTSSQSQSQSQRNSYISEEHHLRGGVRSLEIPPAAAAAINEMLAKRVKTTKTERSALAAVSSSSSEDEDADADEEEDEIRRTILTMMIMSEKEILVDNDDDAAVSIIDDDDETAEPTTSDGECDDNAVTEAQTTHSTTTTPTTVLPTSTSASDEENRATNNLELTAVELNSSEV